ncbi:hypothetical protein FRB90_008907 [Tulasnella sp. 427]|nr:hypothetical protein FRB90_008907 [Tulasnella sp. 427]
MSSPSFNIQEKAYLKFFLHAAKHPHASVTGVFLGRKRDGEEVWDVVDALPLCHRWTGLSPMMEVGLELAEIYADEMEMKIVGYYHASERAQDVALPAHGHQVLQALTTKFPLAFALVFNSSKLPTDAAAIDVVMLEAAKSQKPKSFNFADADVPGRVRKLVRQKGIEKLVLDFDDYLEGGLQNDWLRNDGAVEAAGITG